MNKVVIDAERCNGCGLCVEFCPQDNLQLSDDLTGWGFHQAEVKHHEKCTGCKICVLMCPAVAISIYKEDKKKQEATTQ